MNLLILYKYNIQMHWNALTFNQLAWRPTLIFLQVLRVLDRESTEPV